jgi:hypothetical protein
MEVALGWEMIRTWLFDQNATAGEVVIDGGGSSVAAMSNVQTACYKSDMRMTSVDYRRGIIVARAVRYPAGVGKQPVETAKNLEIET